jgi:hypothetical protein
MEQRINDALAFANYRLTLQVQRKNIQARVKSALVISYQNSIFTVSKELISLVSVLSQSNFDVIVDDDSDNAVKIENPAGFLEILCATYRSAMQIKKEAQDKIKTARNPGKLVGL